MFRIFQELLTNIGRHAEASAVSVRLRTEPGALELAVSDDGHGFDPSLVEGAGGLGLLGMRERARASGGSFALTSQPGNGTLAVLRLELPTP